MRRHAGRVHRVSARSMPYRTVCGTMEVDACMSGNVMHALGIHGVQAARSEQGLQQELRPVGAASSDWWRRRWPVGVDGKAAMAGLPPKPWSPWACARSASAREREGEVQGLR
jgi:hypothetical protein